MVLPSSSGREGPEAADRSMPGHFQYSVDELLKAAGEAASAGVGGHSFRHPGEEGRRARAPGPRRHRPARRLRPQGSPAGLGRHRRPLFLRVHRPRPLRHRQGRRIDNDATLSSRPRPRFPRRGGCDVIAPSGMMDGQVAAIRKPWTARASGQADSGLRGQVRQRLLRPFREAAESPPRFGDRSSYQMDRPTSASPSGDGLGRRGGSRHRHGQAGARLPGRAGRRALALWAATAPTAFRASSP